MSYPGNATLTRDMQERVISTFRQTLAAAAAGNRPEATLGCDFILRLDSLFAPARQLLERMEVGEGPVSTDDLASAIGLASDEAPAATADASAAESPAATAPAAAAAATAQAPDIDDLSDLDLEIGLSEPAASPPEPAAPAPPAAAPTTPQPPPAPEEPAASPPEPPAPAPSPVAPPPAVDQLDDLDLGIGEGVGDEPAPAPQPPELEPPPIEPPLVEPPPVEPPPVEPPPVEAPPVEPPPVAPPVDVPAAEPEAAEVEPPLLEVPEIPALEPEPATAPAPPVAAEPEPEAAPVAAEPEPAATVAAEPEPAVAPGLDELDDLDLSIGAEAEAPPATETVAEEPAPVEAPPAEGAVEEAPAEAPEPAAPPPESVEIPLGTEPAAQLDTESQQRIDDLLAEGQEAFGGGEYQGAIDAWSRIFLIDIDHAEANKRIEEARKLKAEADRKVEEKFHEGLAHLEGGDTDAAAAYFRAVVEMQPSHMAARDYLEKLEAGEVPVPTEISRPADAEPLDGDPGEPGLEAEGVDEEPKDKPDRGTKAVGESMVAVKKSPFKSKGFLAIAAAGLIAVLGGGWYLFDNWSSLFPNSSQEEPAPTAPDPVARAKGLHEQGRTSIAIAQLRRLPPDSPQYDEAAALIARWELEQAPVDLAPEGPSPQELARRDALVAEAGAAAEQREFMRTTELLAEAATVAPLKGPEVQLLARADEQLQELQNFITIFREGEWDLALRDMWLLHESDPGNRDVTRLLVDSYYNLGLRALQRKDVKVAAERFKEALALSPDDPELLRLADFAATYEIRATDLLYRIYVKYHPFR